jgi:hypothetical protein
MKYVTVIILCFLFLGCKKKSDPKPSSNQNTNTVTPTVSASSPVYTEWYTSDPGSHLQGKNIIIYVSKDSMEINYSGSAAGYLRFNTNVCSDQPGCPINLTSTGKYFYRAEYGTAYSYTIADRGYILVASDGKITFHEYQQSATFMTEMLLCGNVYRFTVNVY